MSDRLRGIVTAQGCPHGGPALGVLRSSKAKI